MRHIKLKSFCIAKERIKKESTCKPYIQYRVNIQTIKELLQLKAKKKKKSNNSI